MEVDESSSSVGSNSPTSTNTTTITLDESERQYLTTPAQNMVPPQKPRKKEPAIDVDSKRHGDKLMLLKDDFEEELHEKRMVELRNILERSKTYLWMYEKNETRTTMPFKY